MGKLLKIDDIVLGLASKRLALKMSTSICGQDTDFEELECVIVDTYGNELLYFTYHTDPYQHGGNINVVSTLNPYDWFEKYYKTEDLLKHIG